MECECTLNIERCERHRCWFANKCINGYISGKQTNLEKSIGLEIQGLLDIANFTGVPDEVRRKIEKRCSRIMREIHEMERDVK